MENKFTKGEWTVSYYSSHSSHQTFDVDMINPKFEEVQANAKLIASAPLLLEACNKLLVDFIYSLSNQGKILGWDDEKITKEINNHPLVISTREAINKATK